MPLDVHRVLVCSKKSGRRKPVPKLGTQIGLEFQRDGALDRSDLEHTDIQNILEKLEEWEQVLHTDPLIREKLRDFDSSMLVLNHEQTVLTFVHIKLNLM